MAQDTTSTTTKEDTTTTTTTEAVKVDERPTGGQASVNYPGGDASPAAERQGEVVADKAAETNYVGGDHGTPQDDARVTAENVENAKQEALRNASDEQKQQPSRGSSSDSGHDSDRKTGNSFASRGTARE